MRLTWITFKGKALYHKIHWNWRESNYKDYWAILRWFILIFGQSNEMKEHIIFDDSLEINWNEMNNVAYDIIDVINFYRIPWLLPCYVKYKQEDAPVTK